MLALISLLTGTNSALCLHYSPRRRPVELEYVTHTGLDWCEGVGGTVRRREDSIPAFHQQIYRVPSLC